MNSMISLQNQIFLMLQITITIVLCSAVGLNREKSNKSAGLRTHILTGVGACLFTMLSIHAFPNADSSRVASNVVTGIGFLSGGVIIQRKHEAYDLTTAAGIWATAAIGMAVATGAWLLATYATISVWFVLEVFKKLSNTVSVKTMVVGKETPSVAPVATDGKNTSSNGEKAGTLPYQQTETVNTLQQVTN